MFYLPQSPPPNRFPTRRSRAKCCFSSHSRGSSYPWPLPKRGAPVWPCRHLSFGSVDFIIEDGPVFCSVVNATSLLSLQCLHSLQALMGYVMEDKDARLVPKEIKTSPTVSSGTGEADMQTGHVGCRLCAAARMLLWPSLRVQIFRTMATRCVTRET